MPDDDRLSRIEDLCKETHTHVVGAPGVDGLVTRVAKVEQRQSLFAKIFATLGTSLLALVIWVLKGPKV